MLVSWQIFASPSPKKYTLAVELNPPFTYIDENNRINGLSVEMIGQLVASQDATFEMLVCPFARCLKLAEEGHTDFIFGIIKTAEREEFLHFIEPPFMSSTTHYSFYQLKSHAKPISTLKDLTQLTVGTQRGAKHFSEFDNNPDIFKVEITSIPTLIEMLRKKRIDAFLMLTLSAEPYLKKFDPRRRIKPSPFSYKDQKSGYIALSKKSKHVLDLPLLNKAMVELKRQGEIQKVLNKYNL